jgi:hypothetical protein
VADEDESSPTSAFNAPASYSKFEAIPLYDQVKGAFWRHYQAALHELYNCDVALIRDGTTGRAEKLFIAWIPTLYRELAPKIKKHETDKNNGELIKKLAAIEAKLNKPQSITFEEARDWFNGFAALLDAMGVTKVETEKWDPGLTVGKKMR